MGERNGWAEEKGKNRDGIEGIGFERKKQSLYRSKEKVDVDIVRLAKE